MESHFYADQFYNWFMHNVGNKPLGEHYNLPHTELDLVRNSIYFFELTCVHHKKQIPPKIDCLPLDVLRHISSFITYKHTVVVGFNCPNDYPFIPPRWQVHDAGSFILMEDAVFRHNFEYGIPGNWCMQCMETDILQMVLRILNVVDR